MHTIDLIHNAALFFNLNFEKEPLTYFEEQKMGQFQTQGTGSTLPLEIRNYLRKTVEEPENRVEDITNILVQNLSSESFARFFEEAQNTATDELLREKYKEIGQNLRREMTSNTVNHFIIQRSCGFNITNSMHDFNMRTEEVPSATREGERTGQEEAPLDYGQLPGEVRPFR